MKPIIRAISLFMLAKMLISGLIACSEQPDDGTETTTAAGSSEESTSEEVTTQDNLPELDFAQAEIRFIAVTATGCAARLRSTIRAET